ncbi:MAG TPA: BTAD domain-containing putative transcriptional regulator [Candidatus Limnocylindrales bacterium]|nr:BTAD domain-containing putative transcriptional regulator [Candidatus Limnocylindrales bacterium]
MRRAGPRVDVRLLGRLEVGVRGRPVRIPGRQAQALFALMAIDRHPRSRDCLAATLWPDVEASAASLRQALWLVRSAFAAACVDPGELFVIEPDSVGLRPGAPVHLDSEEFETHLKAAPPNPEAAIALYRGDLAEGLGHDCFAAEQERLSDLYEDALALVAQRRLAVDDFEGARDAADRLLARDVLREEAHAVLISYYGAQGTRSQVVRQYRRLRDILSRELDVDPLPETDLAYRAAMTRAVTDSHRRATSEAFLPRPFTPTLVAQG